MCLSHRRQSENPISKKARDRKKQNSERAAAVWEAKSDQEKFVELLVGHNGHRKLKESLKVFEDLFGDSQQSDYIANIITNIRTNPTFYKKQLLPLIDRNKTGNRIRELWDKAF